MDRSLDEIISERSAHPRGGGNANHRGQRGRRAPSARAPRTNDFPRDGVQKYRQDDVTNIDSDWVHDRYEGDEFGSEKRRRADKANAATQMAKEVEGRPGTRIRVGNLHYDLAEKDIHYLFAQTGPLESVRLLYDRAGRSDGVAFVVYRDPEDARDAVEGFAGCKAHGQVLQLSYLPDEPVPAKPQRSLMSRITGGPGVEVADGHAGRTRARDRSRSPRAAGRLAPPEMDRYQPARGSRSPIRRRGTPRESGRRPGQRREQTDAGPRRARTDDDGRPLVGGRPRKTMEELDAEMADYFNKGDGTLNAGTENGSNGANAGGDVEMDIID